MPRHFLNLVLFLTVANYIAVHSLSAKSPAKRPSLLQAVPVSISKNSPVISDAAKEFLSKRDGNTVKVWVFFTDKQIETMLDFEQAAVSISFSDKILKRRAKADLNQVVFADIPVPAAYIKRVVALGAKHRRTSKWQNAASFEIPFNKLPEVANLPFVSEIKPMGVSKRPPLPQIDLKKESFIPEMQSSFKMNYGLSLGQNFQIMVNKLHEKGFHGEGITLAILDTGFRKTHEAFAAHYADGRVLAEHDFIFNDGNTANEPADHPSQWDHGTLIWSVAGGQLDGKIYGPAFEANFLLAKTEDIRSEMPIEEDNWVAAVEWADSLGADVLTSSLGYIDWYVPSDLNGATAVTTIEANMAASFGIVLCNAAGNGGPGSSSLLAPADAFDILAVGAVNSAGTLANFSSRGPTADGRIKPEVCARGVGTYAAFPGSDDFYGTASGTSLSTPLVAGAACLLVQARPNFPPQIIRQAFLETSYFASTPNNNYGWGLINAEAALGWGAEFSADTTTGYAPVTIQFTANTSLATSSWSWSFGDGGTSAEENPARQYLLPGTYSVALTIESAYGPVTNLKENYIFVNGDTVEFGSDSAFAGRQVVLSVNLINSQPLYSLTIPFKYGSAPDAILDSVTRGNRTGYFESLSLAGQDINNNLFAYQLISDNGGGSPLLPAGSGEVLRIYLTLDSFAFGGFSSMVDSGTVLNTKIQLASSSSAYTPVVFAGEMSTKAILRSDLNYDFAVNILDLNFLVNRIFRGGPLPITIQSGDFNRDFKISILDLNHLVNLIFRGGPPPPFP